MKPSPRKDQDEVVAGGDWLFALHPERRRQVDDEGPDADDLERTQEFATPRRRVISPVLLVAAAAGVAICAGSFFLAPDEAPMVREAVVRAPTPDPVVDAVSAPVMFADDVVALVTLPAVEALLAEGTAASKAGKQYTAWGLFTRAHALAPKNADALFGIALAQHELGNKRLAAATAAQALTAEPEHPATTLLLGFIQQEAGRFASSRRLYEEYLSSHPQSEYARELKSVLLRMPKR